MRFLEFKGSVLLEETDKLAEVGTVVDSLRKDVNVIRHEAVRMKTKGMTVGTFEKAIKDVLGLFCV